jgi:hypothetical protein
MAQILVLGAPDEGCAGKHGRSIPLADSNWSEIIELPRVIPSETSSRKCLVRFR